MDIKQMQKLAGITGGAWKEVHAPATPKSQSTKDYNSDTKNQSATDVRDVSGTDDINQDVAAEMDTATKETTTTARGQVEDQQHTISVDDNGAPKVDDTTVVNTQDPKDVANESADVEGEIIVEAKDCPADCDCEKCKTKDCPADCDCKKCSSDDKKDDKKEDTKSKSGKKGVNPFGSEDEEMCESAGTVNMSKYGNAVKSLMQAYNITDEEAQSVVHVLQGGGNRHDAKIMSKVIPGTFNTAEELQGAAAELFDQHPELHNELMEKVVTKFEAEYNSLKDYVTEAKK